MVDFLILGCGQSAMMKDIFVLFKNQKMKYGYSISSGYRFFEVPDDYEFYGNMCKNEDNKRYIAVSGVRWFTNLTKEYPTPLVLTEKYDEGKYKKFDKYNVINVNKTEDIPDYDGVMGVPVTFLDKWNPGQFEVIGMAHSGGGGLDMFLAMVEGKLTYPRILIKKR